MSIILKDLSFGLHSEREGKKSNSKNLILARLVTISSYVAKNIECSLKNIRRINVSNKSLVLNILGS